tara:strand:- start:492 stop:722 length:231 start_codon:yes stop_codon:yes gene_type:complete
MDILTSVFKWSMIGLCLIFGLYLIQPFVQLIFGAFLLVVAWMIFQSMLPEVKDWRYESLRAEMDGLRDRMFTIWTR